MMKKIIAIGVAALMLSSCNSFLEVEPRQSLDIEAVYQTKEDLTSAIIGSYNRAQDADIFGANLILIPDLMSNNIIWGGSFTDPGEFANIQITVTNGDVDAMYADTYRLVNNVNAVLESIESVELTAEEAAQFRGEALFLRGAILFEAVRFFGRPYEAATASSDLGLPISLTFRKTTEDIAELSRATVEETYQQAIADLSEAASLLPDRVDLGRANRFTALGMLAKIYFQRREYSNAADFAGQVINGGGYALVPNVLNYYTNESNSEDVWSIFHTNQDNPGTNGSLPTFYNEQARGDIIINPDIITNGYDMIITPAQQTAIAGAGLTAEDERFTVLTAINANGSRVVEKYEGFANDDDNAPVLRLPELLLMRAEAIQRENPGLIQQESLDLLNSVRTRAIRFYDTNGDAVAGQEGLVSFTAADFASSAELINAIITERRVELAYEGNRFHDLNRLQQPVKGVAYGDNARVFPIPQDAMQNNSALVQNPGY